ncbi:MAG TPA: Hsp70 family protein [Pseudonocardia sp.]|nr:Hsp70 family protein [Pseudonocardia sp.]
MTLWALGVDIGTSYCAGAVAVGDRVEILEVGGERRVPSTVLLDEDGRLLAGAHARSAAARSPDRAERNPKLYIGRAPMLLGGEAVTAADAIAALLSLFVHEARRRHDGTDPAEVVVTHPVAWTDGQRAELAEAATRVLPGSGVTLLAEPVAAAVHYLHEGGTAGERFAVYDLGGGTFDTAVLAAGRSGFHVVGRPGGDPDIGGEAFDRLVYAHFGAQLAHASPEWWEQVRTSPERRWLAAAAELLAESRAAKEALTDLDTTSRYVAGADADVRMTRAELDELIEPDVRRTALLLAETVAVAGGALRGVFLAGGASRIPLVERTLRQAHGGLVRTWQDPKVVVALGAARWARQRLAAGHARPPTGPRASGRRARAPFVVLADAVLDARVAAGGVCTLSAPDGPGRPHRVARRDAGDGRTGREVPVDETVGWAVSDAGVVVAARRAGELRCHALDAGLALRRTTDVLEGNPLLVADGDLAWVLLRTGVGPAPGARGELGELSVQVLRLGGGAVDPPRAPVRLGPAVHLFLDDGGEFLDPTAPTSGVPVLLGDGRSCALVIGRPAGRSTRGRREQRDDPRQSLGLLAGEGTFSPLVDQRARGAATPWVHQVLRPTGSGPWLLATSVGLEAFDELRSGTGRRLFLARPPGGAVQWVPAGRQVFGVAVEDARTGRGLSLHALLGGRRRELARWPSLLGSPAAARPTGAPRIRVDGERIWVGAGDGAGGSHLVLADRDGARVVASVPGWLEPVGRVGDAVLARHVPESAPGDARTAAGLLVRLRT